MSYAEMPVVFPTLRSVGYERCLHPRTDATNCFDCGAVKHGTAWIGGTLDYHRRPLRLYGTSV